ncbi:unnamed protein product [Musa acuminata subsp. malaccensis]|uniref:(wild Malaysian banana) hypothetical protein n=1 Tax=Musa acuminata subsp. malaccensis TaxID=214687 RepID=A0A804JZG5_MUSAM|nr:unnamed protein product [Musa acuminata subsp. malaccensis]
MASRKWIATFRRPKQILKSADFSRWSMWWESANILDSMENLF